MRARRDSQNTDQIKEKAARASLHLDSGGYGERRKMRQRRNEEKMNKESATTL